VVPDDECISPRIGFLIVPTGFLPLSTIGCFVDPHCDDLRIGASAAVLSSLHASLLARFDVTTAPGNRFLGMDTLYDLERGYLKLSMTSYIVMTSEYFESFDLSQGYPFRESSLDHLECYVPGIAAREGHGSSIQLFW
jgi:hypothetical protein